MKIAVPVAEGKLSQHFGHCREVAMFEVDPQAKTILSTRLIPTPPHEPGRFPAWLKGQGADMVIAGGMGQRALELFQQADIQTIVGAPSELAETVVTVWLQGNLASSSNACNHGAQEHHECGDHHGEHKTHSCGGHHA